VVAGGAYARGSCSSIKFDEGETLATSSEAGGPTYEGPGFADNRFHWLTSCCVPPLPQAQPNDADARAATVSLQADKRKRGATGRVRERQAEGVGTSSMKEGGEGRGTMGIG